MTLPARTSPPFIQHFAGAHRDGVHVRQHVLISNQHSVICKAKAAYELSPRGKVRKEKVNQITTALRKLDP